jgi:hypothetical protein
MPPHFSWLNTLFPEKNPKSVAGEKVFYFFLLVSNKILNHEN